MRTYKLEVAIDLKAIVPDEWVQQLRLDAVSEAATPFLKKAQELFPEDDEDFALHILKNGVRLNVRQGLQDLFVSSGLGCTLSPARAAVIDRSPPKDVEPVLASEIDAALSGSND